MATIKQRPARPRSRFQNRASVEHTRKAEDLTMLLWNNARCIPTCRRGYFSATVCVLENWARGGYETKADELFVGDSLRTLETNIIAAIND